MGRGTRGQRIKVKAKVTQEGVAAGVVWMPFHFGGHFQGKDLRDKYPKGSDPYVLGEACNTAFTYGYDSVTQMQETKCSLCRISTRLIEEGDRIMARMKFLCDAERCIECNGCVTACKNENDVPWGVNRRRVVTINDGSPGETLHVGRLHALLGCTLRGSLSGRLFLHHR